jgi:hypothetical protein
MSANQHARHGTESVLALADTLPARCEVAEAVRSSAGLGDGLAKEDPGHVADVGLAGLVGCGIAAIGGCLVAGDHVFVLRHWPRSNLAHYFITSG